jgi:Cys-rich protein (TIGR01571 family)
MDIPVVTEMYVVFPQYLSVSCLVRNFFHSLFPLFVANTVLTKNQCMAYAALTVCVPLYFILGMLQRSEIRQKYNLKGSGCGDCCRACCCTCCALIQEENEVVAKTKKQNEGSAYQSMGGMHYGNNA